MVLAQLARAIRESPDIDALEEAVRRCLATTRSAMFVEAMATSIGHFERGGFSEQANDLSLLFAVLRPQIAEKRSDEQRRARAAIGATKTTMEPMSSDSSQPRGLRASDFRVTTRMRLR